MSLENRRQALIEDNLGFSFMFRALAGTASGTNTYSVTLNQAEVEGYWDGMEIIIIFANANTGASTININGQGAIPLKDKLGADLTAGAIEAGGAHKFYYSSALSTFSMIETGSAGASIISPSLSESLLFHHSSIDVSGSTVNDQTGVSSLTPRNLYCYSANEAGVDASLPHGTGSSTSIDFDWTDDWGVGFWVKSTNTAATSRILSNRIWSGNFQGIDIFSTTSGIFTVDLYSKTGHSIRKQISGTGNDINGTSQSGVTAMNDGTWRFFYVQVTGNATPANVGIDIWTFNSSGVLVKTANSTGTETGTYTSDPLASGSDWGLGNRSGGSNDVDTQLQHIKFYSSGSKTFAEVLDIANRKEDQTNILRYYACEEEDGAILYNSAIVDTGNRRHGTITGGGSNGRVNDGVYSWANKKGYNTSGSTIIPYDMLGADVDATGSSIADAGKVSFNGEQITASPFTWKPNPNDYDELTNLGFTSATVIAGADRDVFKNTEVSTQLFKNNTSTDFIGYDHDLVTFTAYNVATDEKGAVMASIGHRTPCVWLGGQSNAVGTNTVSASNDISDPSYENELSNCFIANNGGGTGVQSVTGFENYHYTINDDGTEVGADVVFMNKMNNYYEHEVYLYKYAIGSTSLLSRSGDTLNHWHPTQNEGTGLRLYPSMIAGLNEAVALLESTGRNVDTYVYWHQGEADRAKTTDYTGALNALDSELQTDETTYNGRFALVRGHEIHFDLISPNIIANQEAWVSADSNREIINAEFDSSYYHDTDNVHIEIAGQELLGDRWADIMASWLGISLLTKQELLDEVMALTDLDQGFSVQESTGGSGGVYQETSRTNLAEDGDYVEAWEGFGGDQWNIPNLEIKNQGDVSTLWYSGEYSTNDAPPVVDRGSLDKYVKFRNGENLIFETQTGTISPAVGEPIDVVTVFRFLPCANQERNGLFVFDQFSNAWRWRFGSSTEGVNMAEMALYRRALIRYTNDGSGNWEVRYGNILKQIPDDSGGPAENSFSATDYYIGSNSHPAEIHEYFIAMNFDAGGFSSASLEVMQRNLNTVWPDEPYPTYPNLDDTFDIPLFGSVTSGAWTVNKGTFRGGSGTEGTGANKTLHKWVYHDTSDSTRCPIANKLDNNVEIGGRVVVTGGSAGGGNTVSSVDVDGTELLGSSVSWTTSDINTASLIAAEINANTTSGLAHGFTADTEDELGTGTAMVRIYTSRVKGNGVVFLEDGVVTSTANGTVTTTDIDFPIGNELTRATYGTTGDLFDGRTVDAGITIQCITKPRDDQGVFGEELISEYVTNNVS